MLLYSVRRAVARAIINTRRAMTKYLPLEHIESSDLLFLSHDRVNYCKQMSISQTKAIT